MTWRAGCELEIGEGEGEVGEGVEGVTVDEPAFDDAMARQRDALARSIAALLVEQDDLLDRMAAELTNR